MDRDGLAAAPVGTTAAPKGMYEEVEQTEEVARGHVKVKEIIAYDVIGKRKDEDGKPMIKDGKPVDLEKGRRPVFCQTKEQELIFMENNPGVRMESYDIQLLKSTALKYLNDPENMKQFRKVEELVEEPVESQKEKAIAAFNRASTGEPLEEPEPSWRQQAKQLGIPLNKETGGSRKKEDVLTDIVANLTQRKEGA